MKICVLIRVYDRIEDLRYNLEIIKNTWKKYAEFNLQMQLNSG